MMLHLLLIGVGGFVGSVARFWLTNELNKHRIGTWLTNITGSILLALAFLMYINELITEPIWLLIGVGFCGAYTTFSTFGKETISLLLEKEYIQAIVYIVSSILVSFLFVAFVVIW